MEAAALLDHDAPALLRLATLGSVDDGKSTLIGRLLHDTRQIADDQLEHVRDVSSRRGGGTLDLALLTDGLRAEREQGITIDVAYRSFLTPRRALPNAAPAPTTRLLRPRWRTAKKRVIFKSLSPPPPF